MSKHKKEIGVDIENNKNLETNVDECIITNASVPTTTVLSEVPSGDQTSPSHSRIQGLLPR